MTDAPTKPRSRRLPVVVFAAALLGGGELGHRAYLARLPYEWAGTVEARTIAIGSRAGGRVKEVLVREGEHVAQGQPLVTLEPGELPGQLLEAKGELAQMKANLEKLEHGARKEELDEARAKAAETNAAFEEMKAGARREAIAAAAARLAAEEAAVERAKTDADRMHRVKEKAAGAVSQADVDAADLALKQTLATRDAAKQQLAELENGSRPEDVAQAEARALQAKAQEALLKAGTRAEDIDIAKGQVAAAQGKVDRIQSLVDELVIKAPKAARVEACELRPGDILAPNATAATLLEDGELYVRIYVPETQLGHVKVGMTIPFVVDSFPDRTFEGTVEHVNGIGEYTPRNLQTVDERADQVFGVRVGLKAGEEDVRAGMAAFARVPR
ncbi:MAG TPA: efflux RND transporter periplasmic adaptor subunit [Planctomycetota bacterium]|nr:efflux RND transporter periplasmic adaptor subunit [Planctomycetota bacterium]